MRKFLRVIFCCCVLFSESAFGFSPETDENAAIAQEGYFVTNSSSSPQFLCLPGYYCPGGGSSMFASQHVVCDHISWYDGCPYEPTCGYNGGNCGIIKCPDGMTSNAGAVSVDDCFVAPVECPDGQTTSYDGTSCRDICGVGTELNSNYISLPDGYTQIEYIESTGTQWIDTGFVANQDTRIVTRVVFNTTTNNKTSVFGMCVANYARCIEASLYKNKISAIYTDYDTYGYGGVASPSPTPTVKIGDVVDIDFNKNITYYSINSGEQITITHTYVPFTTPGTMPLGKEHKSATNLYSYINLYNTKIYDNETLVRDFVPVKRNSDGAIGMYDRVSGEFFGNSGTGEFIAGPVVGGACFVCDTGYYNSVGNDTQCVACPVGYSATGDNTTDHDEISDCVITCPAGQYIASANGECVPVPAGYYAPNKHSVGYGQTSSDVGGILQCPNGQTSGPGAAKCRDICGTGTEVNPNYISLPDDYTQLEYIESTGTQWIDTGVKANTTTSRYETKIMPTNIVKTQAVFGSRNTAGTTDASSCNMFILENKIFRFDWASGNLDATKSVTANTEYIITITRGYISINGAEYTYANTQSIDQNNNFLIGSLTNGSSTPDSRGFIGRTYYGKLYNDNTVVRDLVPVRRNSDGAIGMYDRVSGEFFGNSGTGVFIAGPVVGGACLVCPINYYNSVGNDTPCVACPSGLVSPMGSVDAGSCGRKIHIGDEIIYLRSVKKTAPSLNFDIDNDGVADFFGNATLQRTHINSTSQHFLHVGDYYIYDDTVTPEK